MHARGQSPFSAPRRGRQQKQTKRRQLGQAYAEYLVVTAALIGILLLAAGDETAPLVALVRSLKSLFDAYSYTLSLP